MSWRRTGAGFVHPMEDDPDPDPIPELPGRADEPEDDERSNFSFSFLREGKFKGGGTDSFGMLLFCPDADDDELRGRERTTKPPPPDEPEWGPARARDE